MERDKKAEKKKEDEVHAYCKELTSFFFFWTAKVAIESIAKSACVHLCTTGINISTSISTGCSFCIH